MSPNPGNSSSSQVGKTSMREIRARMRRSARCFTVMVRPRFLAPLIRFQVYQFLGVEAIGGRDESRPYGVVALFFGVFVGV